MVTEKPFIQKAYEKWVMLLFSAISQFSDKLGKLATGKLKDFDGLIGVYPANDSNGIEGLYICIVSKDGIIPIAKLLSQHDVPLNPELNSDGDPDDSLAKKFYEALGNETRFTLKDFDKIKVMPEFKDYYPVE